MSLALCSCQQPLFYESHTADCVGSLSDLALSLSPIEDDTAVIEYHWSKYQANLDSELAGVLETMKKFCTMVNGAAETGHKLPEQMLLHVMSSAMYRLLCLRFSTGSINEAVRLGLLAFCSQIFLQWRGFRPPHLQLASRYKNSLLDCNSSDEATPETLLWLLMIGTLSVFDEMDSFWLKPWLRSTVELCQARSWTQLRHIMGSFLWIGFIHDQPGKDTFNSLVLSGHCL